MLDLNNLPEDAIVTVTVQADPADVAAAPTVNGVTKSIPNNEPTQIPVSFALVLVSSGFKVTLGDDVVLPSEGSADATTESTDAPAELGGSGAGDGDSQVTGDGAVPNSPASQGSEIVDAGDAFDPTPILDGNADTAIARIRDGLSPAQLDATLAAEQAGRKRTTVIKAIEAARKAD